MANPYIRLRTGQNNVYCLQGSQGYVLVDAGPPGTGQSILSRLKSQDIRPQEIVLIVVTHAHFDHVGGLKVLAEATRADVLAHRYEAELLRKGRLVLPPGRNLFFDVLVRASGLFVNSFVTLEPIDTQLIIEEPHELAAYGIAGRVIPTPGHTQGSLSVVTEAGQAFVGDLCTNAFPLNLSAVAPPFLEDPEAVAASYRKLMALDIDEICPAHGAPFSAAKLEGALELVQQKG